MEWISVKDRLPDTEDNVLGVVNGVYKNITFSNAIMIVGFDKIYDEWCLDEFPEAENFKVSYWQPLPEPPKED